MTSSQITKYSLLARYLHWSMALLIVVQFSTKLYVFVQGKADPNILAMIQAHHASGILILLFIMVRISVRYFSSPPTLLQDNFTVTERNMAKIGHITLYALMFIMPVSGYIIMDTSFYGTHFYAYSMPDLLSVDEPTMNKATFMHWLGAWVIGLCILGHVSIAILHRRKIPNFINRMI